MNRLIILIIVPLIVSCVRESQPESRQEPLPPSREGVHRGLQDIEKRIEDIEKKIEEFNLPTANVQFESGLVGNQAIRMKAECEALLKELHAHPSETEALHGRVSLLKKKLERAFQDEHVLDHDPDLDVTDELIRQLNREHKPPRESDGTVLLVDQRTGIITIKLHGRERALPGQRLRVWARQGKGWYVKRTILVMKVDKESYRCKVIELDNPGLQIKKGDLIWK